MKTKLLKGTLETIFNSLLALLKKKKSIIQNICIKSFVPFFSLQPRENKVKVSLESILRANYYTYHNLLYLLRQKSYKYFFPHIYMLEVAFKIGASFNITLKKKWQNKKKKIRNESTTKVQQVTFFSKENLIRATTFNKKVKVPRM